MDEQPKDQLATREQVDAALARQLPRYEEALESLGRS